MTRNRWLWTAAAAGIAIFALSFVNGWIFHDREIRGEGYRHAQIYLSAWRNVAVPVTSAAAVGALAVGLGAAARALGRAQLRPRPPSGLLVVGAAIVVGLIVASAWPVEKVGHASTVTLSVAWLLPVVLLLAVGMAVALVRALGPTRRVVVVAAAIAVLATVGGAAGRWLGLQLAEGTGRHWEVGSYTRPAIDGGPSLTLALTAGRYEIGDRWAGTFESSGWTVILDNDPACPDARGTYHAHGENEADLRFVMVVDPCRDGARAADLEAAIWERVP